jgi:hypothetical protein
MSTIPTQNVPPCSVEELVRRLLALWRAKTLVLSSTTAIVSHPACRELIAIGPAALPFLFQDLAQTHDGHLSGALVALTGAQPVPSEEGGKIRAVAERWLDWAREHGS